MASISGAPGRTAGPVAGLRHRLTDRFYAWRDGLLASPRFQRIAARLPIARSFAERDSRALFDLVAGFVYSQVLAACVSLDLFERVARGPLAIDDLARACDLDRDAMARLVDAAIALRLLSRRADGRIGLGMLGGALRGNPGAIAMVKHHAILYRDLSDPVGLLRSGGRDAELARFWTYARRPVGETGSATEAETYSALMTASQSLVSADILSAYSFARHRRLLDIGGGDGAFLSAVARAAPRLALTLVDLPPVAEAAARRFQREGLATRAEAIGGDFRDLRFPSGADVISLVRVLYDHPDEVVRALLRKVHAALPPGGTIVIAEPMAGVPGHEAMGDAYFGFYLLAMNGGRPRSAQTMTTLLTEAGFADAAPRKTLRPMLVSVVTARKA
jgi:demethylspheroidene O-methyltransferase